jgi:hypothetical protein
MTAPTASRDRRAPQGLPALLAPRARLDRLGLKARTDWTEIMALPESVE